MRRTLGVGLLFYVVALHTSIAALEILSWLLMMAVLVQSFRLQRAPKINMAMGLALGLLVLTLLSTVFSTTQSWADFGFMRWTVLLLGWSVLLPDYLNDEKTWVPASRVWFAVLIGVGLYACMQAFLGIDPLRPHNLVQLGRMWRATGLYSMSITFASIVAMSAVMAAAWVIVGPKENQRMAIIATVLGLLATVLTLSRAASIAVFAVLLLAILLARPQWFWRAAIGLGVSAVVAIAAFDSVRTRLTTLLSLSSDHSTSLRAGLWQSYWAIFTENPWWGVGLFRPRHLLPEYYARFGIAEPFYSHAHSNWLQWLAGAGSFSALVFLSLSVWMLWISFKLFKTSHDSRWRVLGLGTLAAQLVFHLEGFIECNFFDAEVNHMIVFIWALALAGSALAQQPSSMRPKLSPAAN